MQFEWFLFHGINQAKYTYVHFKQFNKVYAQILMLNICQLNNTNGQANNEFIGRKKVQLKVLLIGNTKLKNVSRLTQIFAVYSVSTFFTCFDSLRITLLPLQFLWFVCLGYQHSLSPLFQFKNEPFSFHRLS